MKSRCPMVGLVVISMASAHLGQDGSSKPEHKTPPSAAIGALLTASSTATASVSQVLSFANATTGARSQRYVSIDYDRAIRLTRS